MLVQKAWDHAIELKEVFVLKKGKVYLLSREEREEVQTFVDLPVHFVAKKDGKKKIVQDY